MNASSQSGENASPDLCVLAILLDRCAILEVHAFRLLAVQGNGEAEIMEADILMFPGSKPASRA